MRQLRREVEQQLPVAKPEQRICGKTKFAVDFFLPEQAAVIEVALGLRNSLTEFERDVFKVLLALDAGCKVKRLVFIAKPGAVKIGEAAVQQADASDEVRDGS